VFKKHSKLPEIWGVMPKMGKGDLGKPPKSDLFA
jgi:hypothetical protein